MNFLPIMFPAMNKTKPKTLVISPEIHAKIVMIGASQPTLISVGPMAETLILEAINARQSRAANAANAARTGRKNV